MKINVLDFGWFVKVFSLANKHSIYCKSFIECLETSKNYLISVVVNRICSTLCAFIQQGCCYAVLLHTFVIRTVLETYLDFLNYLSRPSCVTMSPVLSNRGMEGVL